MVCTRVAYSNNIAVTDPAKLAQAASLLHTACKKKLAVQFPERRTHQEQKITHKDGGLGVTVHHHQTLRPPHALAKEVSSSAPIPK